MKNRIIALLTVATMITLAGCGAETANSNAVEVVASVETETETVETETIEPEEETEMEETETETTQAEPEETETTQEETTEETTTEQATPAYTYNDMSAIMYATQSLNVRNLPDTTGEKIGALSLNQEVTVVSQCVETGWYSIEFNNSNNSNNSVGYVSNKYLSNDKIEVKVEQPVNTSASTPSTPSSNAPESNASTAESNAPTASASTENPYDLYTVIDNGGTDVYFYYLNDGTPMRSQEFWDCFNACIEILKTRTEGNTQEGGNEFTKYYVDSLRVAKSTPRWYTR